MNTQELVSVITPAFNAEHLLSQSIESVLAQTYTNWEMIIVDDCSTDGSLKVATEYSEKDHRIKFLQQTTNSGVAACRNAATKHASGRYIAFLDSDDLWHPEKLSRQIAFMQKKGAVLSYTSYKKIDNEGNISQDTVHARPQVSYDQLLKSNEIGCLTAIYDSKETGKLKLIETYREDYILWLTILKKGYSAYGLDEPLAFYRVGNTSLSSNKLKIMRRQWNIYRKIEKLPLTKSIYLFFWYTYKGYKKFRIR